MMQFSYVIVTVFLLAFIAKDSYGTGILSLKLLTYENPSHKLMNGNCCDSGCQPCDNYFRFCLSHVASTDCSIGFLWTDLEGGDSFTFGSTIWRAMDSYNSVGNPLLFSFDSWNGTFNLKIEVYDADHSIDVMNHPSNDHVDTLSLNVTYEAALSLGTAQAQRITLLGKPRGLLSGPKLVGELSVYCNTNYMLPSCAEFCIDTDDSTGHYHRNYTAGKKECLVGWYGLNCNLKVPFCEPRNDSLGHYRCHENGTKQCLPGWIKPEENCTEAVAKTESSSPTYSSIVISSTRRATMASIHTQPLTRSTNLRLSHSATTTAISISAAISMSVLSFATIFADPSKTIESKYFSISTESANSSLASKKASLKSPETLSTNLEYRISLTRTSNQKIMSSYASEWTKRHTSISSTFPVRAVNTSNNDRPLNGLPIVATTPSGIDGNTTAPYAKTASKFASISASLHTTTDTSPVTSNSLSSSTQPSSMFSQSVTPRTNIKSGKGQGRHEGLLWLILLAVPVIFFTFAIVYLYQTNHRKRISRVHSEIMHPRSVRLTLVNVKPTTTTKSSLTTTTTLMAT